MKRILKLAVLPLLFLSAVSCSDDDAKATANPGTAPVLSSEEDGTSIVLTAATGDDTALSLTWTAATYTVATPPNYTVQVAKSGTNFEEPASINPEVRTQLNHSITVANLNEAVVEAGIIPLEEGDVEVRVVASLGDGNLIQIPSNVITLKVTPFPTDNPRLYLRGNFTAASGYGPDWGDNTNPPYIEGPTATATNYEGYIYFNNAAPEFKLIPNAVDFTGDYGDAEGSGASGKLIQEGETNIKVPAAGYYLVKANLSDLTYSLTKTEWGLIGSATAGVTGGDGWANDADLEYDAENKVWKIEITLVAGDIKFRANNAWDLNYGDDNKDGILEFNTANIPVTAGTYLITLDLSTPNAYKYTITPQ